MKDPNTRVGATPWMIDCEFVEEGPGRPLELISIALVSDDGREYYAANQAAHPASSPNISQRCSAWVRSNVLPHLPPPQSPAWKTREQIKSEIFSLVTANAERPQFWGYYADYDWVLFAQLWGRMIDLPPGWPMFCMDLKQSMVECGVSSQDMAEDPPGFIEHHALHDARKQMAWLARLNRYHRRQP